MTRIAMDLAGFSAREGGDLRKVLSKKHRERRLGDLKGRFFAEAFERCVPGGVVEAVWGQILSFAGYLFPDVYRRVCRRLTPVRPCLLEGRVEEEFGVCTLTVARVGFLDRGGQGG